MSSLTIASVGEATIDQYQDLGQSRVGGISLNFAVNARRCGADGASLITRVGDDCEALVRDKLEREGVDASHVQIRSGRTARQDILLSDAGERIFPAGGYQANVLDGYLLDAAELAFLGRHAAVFCPLFSQIEPLFLQVVEQMPYAGRRVADFLDLGDYDRDPRILERYAGRLAIAFVSGDSALADRLLPLSRSSPCLLVVTLGAGGSLALADGQLIHQGAVPVAEVKDTTGCGDAFQAAFTVSYLRNQDVRLALRRGAEQAATVAQHIGGTGQ